MYRQLRAMHACLFEDAGDGQTVIDVRGCGMVLTSLVTVPVGGKTGSFDHSMKGVSGPWPERGSVSIVAGLGSRCW